MEKNRTQPEGYSPSKQYKIHQQLNYQDFVQFHWSFDIVSDPFWSKWPFVNFAKWPFVKNYPKWPLTRVKLTKGHSDEPGKL